MSEVCGHDGWGDYSDETGPKPPPAEKVGPCAHQQECPVCQSHTFVSCTCAGTRAINYMTAVQPGYETR